MHTKITDMLAHLESADIVLRRYAAWELGRLGPEAIAALRACLNDTNEDVRWNARESLAALRGLPC